MLGLVGVGLELLAEALHVHVERLGIPDVVGAPDLVDEEVPGEQPPFAIRNVSSSSNSLGVSETSSSFTLTSCR